MKQTSKTNVVVGTNSHSYYPPSLYVMNKINNGRFCDTSYVVAVGDLKNLQNKGKIEFDLPGLGCCVKATATTVKYTDDNNYTWSANIDEEGTPTCDCEMGSISLIRKNGEYMAHFSVDDATYRLESVGGGKHVLAELDINSTEGCATNTGSSPSATIYNEADGMGSGKNNCPVDVLVVYTAAAIDAVADIEMAIPLEIEKTNAAYDRSNVKFELNLVGMEQVSFVEYSPSIEIDGVTNLPNDIEIANLRNLYIADIVVLVTDDVYNGFGGIAAETGVNEAMAYAIVEVGTFVGYNVAHEVGHLFGCMHETNAPDPPTFQHPHNWKTGFMDYRVSIMQSATSTGYKVAQNFSNPQVLHSGKATGIWGLRNNAAQLNAAHCDVAAFRYDPTAPLGGALDAPFAVCLEEDVLVDADIFGGHVGTYQYTWSYSYDGFTYTSAGYTNLDYAWIPGIYTEPPTSTATFTVYTKLDVTDADGNAISLFASTQITNNAAGQASPCGGGPLRLANQQQHSSLVSKAVIYPNPVQNTLNINVGNNNEDVAAYLVEVFSTQGELILSSQNLNNIDVQNLASGTYFIRVQTPDKTYSEKIIKL